VCVSCRTRRGRGGPHAVHIACAMMCLRRPPSAPTTPAVGFTCGCKCFQQAQFCRPREFYIPGPPDRSARCHASAVSSKVSCVCSLLTSKLSRRTLRACLAWEWRRLIRDVSSRPSDRPSEGCIVCAYDDVRGKTAPMVSSCCSSMTSQQQQQQQQQQQPGSCLRRRLQLLSMQPCVRVRIGPDPALHIHCIRIHLCLASRASGVRACVPVGLQRAPPGTCCYRRRSGGSIQQQQQLADIRRSMSGGWQASDRLADGGTRRAGGKGQK
jgi:hypothetical protein